MKLKKNILLGKVKLIFYLIFYFQLTLSSSNSENLFNDEKFAELNILDKVSSKTSNIKVKIGEEIIFQNLVISILKCQNSKFDDDPEITAYMQVRDNKIKDLKYVRKYVKSIFPNNENIDISFFAD